MTTPSSPADQLDVALSATGELVAGVRDDQWSAPTPCTEWTVRDLVNHLVGANRFFTARLRDRTPPDRGADHLGGDPTAAFRDSAAELQAAFDQPGVPERTFQAPIGALPGSALLQLRMTDLLVHAWDLAQATGQAAELPDDLAEQALAFSMARLASATRTGRFGPAQPVADDAPAIDRLVAYLGRPVRPGR
jgi:uncharacterized protein (TIGR03086 family)